jgi:hypothetical protein
MLVAVHNLEPSNRALMLVLDLSQDCLDVVGHRSLALAGVGDRNREGRDRVREISLRLSKVLP